MEAKRGCDTGKSRSILEAKDDRNLEFKSNAEDAIYSKEMDKIDEAEISVKKQLIESSHQNKMRIALGVLIRLVLPLCNGLVRGWKGIRGVSLLKVLRNLSASRQMMTNMLAYAANSISTGLSSVQVVYRIDPILKIMKLKKGSSAESIGTVQSPGELRSEEHETFVTLNVLAEPSLGMPIKADIIFVHGLHGSLVNTWKQGRWNSLGRQAQFQRPPRPPLRPPKRPRHTTSSRIFPPHIRKRPRYTNMDDYLIQQESDISENENHVSNKKLYSTYECGEPDVIGNIDGVEFSFPTFRLRLDDDNSTEMTSAVPLQNSAKDKSIEKAVDSEKYSNCWPGDWLPLDCPGVRVIALNYTTDPYLWRPVWIRKRHRTNLRERAREMSELLIKERVGYGHPIVWVGHSKGGIFIKQIIVDAWETGRPSAAPLWRYSRGVFFYSVPHRGSPLADFNLPLLRRSVELIEIQKNCPSILDLHRRFVALYHSGHLKIDVFSFVETALTLMSVLYLRIVGVDSADPGIGEVCGVHLDHREICKPRNRNCILYTELVKMINRVS